MLEIDFLGTPKTTGALTSTWLRAAADALLNPLLDRLKRDLGAPTELEPDEFIRDGTWYVSLQTTTARGNNSFYAYTSINFEGVLRKLSAGRLAEAEIEIEDLTQTRGRALTAECSVAFDSVRFEGFANSVGTSIPAEWLDRYFGPNAEELVTSLAKSAATNLQAATGYVALASGRGHQTSYEEAVGARWGDSLRRTTERVRGPYWITVLSEGHIRALGGASRIKSDAPCEVIEDLTAGGVPLIWLQATRNIRSFDARRQAHLKKFLEPVLPQRSDQSPATIKSSAPESPTRTSEVAASEATTPYIDLSEMEDKNASLTVLEIDDTPPASYPDVHFRLQLNRHLADDEKHRIEEVLTNWYRSWFYARERAGGGLHYMTEPDFDDDEDGQPIAVWYVDFGSAPTQAVGDLLRQLDRLAANGLPLRKMFFRSHLIR